jgi:hypothetical protein
LLHSFFECQRLNLTFSRLHGILSQMIELLKYSLSLN